MVKSIEELNIGDEIVITLVTKVIEKGEAFGSEPVFVNTSFIYEDGTCIGFSDYELSHPGVSIIQVGKSE